MTIRHGLLVSLFIATLTLAACGGGGGGGGDAAPGPGPDTTPPVTQPPGTVITAPTVSAILSFTQSVASKDSGTFNEVFPGQANVWSLDQDFALVDGFDDQFNYALLLTVGAATFPSDQKYSELIFFNPLMGTADGVKVAAVSDGATVFPSIQTTFQGTLPVVQIASVKAGTYAAFLNATSDSRLQQTLDLTSATSPVSINWSESVSVEPGNIPGYDPSYRVVVRKPDGTLLKELFANPVSTKPTPLGRDLSPFIGQTVVISFEEHSSTVSFSQSWAIIDSVSVKDGGGHEYVSNGGFETGDLTGWTTNTPAEAQNATSGVRNLEGLDVKRSFYTVPNKLWGRWVDVFENNTGAAITKAVTYETSLGSDGAGIIYYAPGTVNKALTSWDSLTGDRDVGLVFGNATSVSFISDDGTGLVGDPLGIVKVIYNISVPAGGRVAIVNFVIMDGTDTGLANPGTTNIAAQATDIDAEAAKIVSNFWTDPQYQLGMTQQQIDAISNFAKTN